MALFPRASGSDPEFLTNSDTASGALSVTAVETDFVASVYGKLSSVYDYTFGPLLHSGRVSAIARLGIERGEHVLEVGVGTGINVPMYPASCRVTGVDLSASMLEKAHARVARHGVRKVRLHQMDASDLAFEDNSFDLVYAPYLISVVSDPVKVADEMWRVCRPGGRIVLLNHFRSANPLVSRLERVVSPLTVHIGFKSDLDLSRFLSRTRLKPRSIEKIAFPPIWSLVTCIKD